MHVQVLRAIHPDKHHGELKQACSAATARLNQLWDQRLHAATTAPAGTSHAGQTAAGSRNRWEEFADDGYGMPAAAPVVPPGQRQQAQVGAL